jgi:hypothetical protein
MRILNSLKNKMYLLIWIFLNNFIQLGIDNIGRVYNSFVNINILQVQFGNFCNELLKLGIFINKQSFLYSDQIDNQLIINISNCRNYLILRILLIG